MFGAIQAESRMPELIFDPLDSAGAEEGGYVVYRLGRKVFRLNKADPRAQPKRKLGTNPFAWLNEAIVPRKEKNSFETCLTQYQPAAVCKMLARRT